MNMKKEISNYIEINKEGQVLSAGSKTPMKGGEIVEYDGKHPHYIKENKGNSNKQNITNYRYKNGKLIYSPSTNKKRLKKEKDKAIKKAMKDLVIDKLKKENKWKSEWDNITGGKINASKKMQ